MAQPAAIATRPGRRLPRALATVVRAGTSDAAGERPLAVDTLHDGSASVGEVGDALVRRAELRVGRVTVRARPFHRTVPTARDHHRRRKCGDASAAAPSRSLAYSKRQRHDGSVIGLRQGRSSRSDEVLTQLGAAFDAEDRPPLPPGHTPTGTSHFAARTEPSGDRVVARLSRNSSTGTGGRHRRDRL